MRRFLCAVVLLFVIAVPASTFPITQYRTDMQIQSDSSVIVTERITADFTGDPHHGIFRDIPFAGRDKYGNKYRIRYNLLAVTDESGSKLKYQEINRSGGYVRIKIGDPETYVQGPQTYVIQYKLLRAVHFFNTYDELYWNVIGPEWEVPIQNASAVITLPKAVSKERIQTASYTGLYGSTASEAQSDVPNANTARFWMTRELTRGEAMTIVVGWPKGIVRQPALGQEIVWFVADNGYFFLPPIFLLALLFYWYKVGKDPNTGQSEMVAYEPPDKMLPAEVGTLTDETVDIRDISASIIDLAVRGYLHITASQEKTFLSTKTDYLLELQKPYDQARNDPELTVFEKRLVKALFTANERRWVSELANHFYVHLPKLKDDLYDGLVKKGYFSHRPDAVRTNYVALGAVIAAVGILGAILTYSGEVPLIIAPGWLLALAVCGGFVMASSKAMPRKTLKGRNAFIGIKGFEEYLTRAEKHDIHFQEKHDLFEKFLPYAMALGIADKWARAFERLGLEPPDWYTGDGDTFHPILFVHDLDMATNNWAGAMTSQPRSQGGGGSGFFSGGSGFGGGSSGGGGGGGGGGGW